MLVTIVLLVLTAVCASPGLFPGRRGPGGRLLRAVMLPQGLAGVFLLIAAPATVILGVLFPDVLGWSGAAEYLRTSLFLSNAAVFFSGVLFTFGLVVKAASRRASPEIAGRTGEKYVALAKFLPVVGLLCLLLAAWCLLAAFLPPPAPPVETGV